LVVEGVADGRDDLRRPLDRFDFRFALRGVSGDDTIEVGFARVRAVRATLASCSGKPVSGGACFFVPVLADSSAASLVAYSKGSLVGSRGSRGLSGFEGRRGPI